MDQYLVNHDTFLDNFSFTKTINGTEYALDAAGRLVPSDSLSFMGQVNNFVMWLTSPAALRELSYVTGNLTERLTMGAYVIGPILQEAADTFGVGFNATQLNDFEDVKSASHNLARPLARAANKIYEYASRENCEEVLNRWAAELLAGLTDQGYDFTSYKSVSLSLQAGAVENIRTACVRERTYGGHRYEINFDPRVGRSRRDVVEPSLHLPVDTLLHLVRPAHATAPTTVAPWTPGGAVPFTW